MEDAYGIMEPERLGDMSKVYLSQARAKQQHPSVFLYVGEICEPIRGVRITHF